MDELTVSCGNCKGKHIDALGVKMCYAETAAQNADDPAEFRRFMGEKDFAKVQDFLLTFDEDDLEREDAIADPRMEW